MKLLTATIKRFKLDDVNRAMSEGKNSRLRPWIDKSNSGDMAWTLTSIVLADRKRFSAMPVFMSLCFCNALPASMIYRA